MLRTVVPGRLEKAFPEVEKASFQRPGLEAVCVSGANAGTV